MPIELSVGNPALPRAEAARAALSVSGSDHDAASIARAFRDKAAEAFGVLYWQMFVDVFARVCQFEIFWAIVKDVAVDVVNALGSRQHPANFLSQNHAVFGNAPVFVGHRMFWAKNVSVATDKCDAALPCVAPWAFTTEIVNTAGHVPIIAH